MGNTGNQGVTRDEDGRVGAGPGEGVPGDKGHTGTGGINAGLGQNGGVRHGEAGVVRGVGLGNYKEVNFLNVHDAVDEGGLSVLFTILTEGFAAHVPSSYSKATGLETKRGWGHRRGERLGRAPRLKGGASRAIRGDGGLGTPEKGRSSARGWFNVHAGR